MKATLLLRGSRPLWQRVPWVLYALAASLLATMVYIFLEATLVRLPPPLVRVVLASTAVGLILAATRWRLGWVFAYSFFISLLAALQVSARVFPFSAVDTFYSWLEVANRELFFFFYRVGGWGATLLEGNPVREENWWQFWLVFLSWNLTAWLVIGLMRRVSAWWLLLPLVTVTAWIVYYRQLDLILLMVILIISFSLAAYLHYRGRRRHWDAKRYDYPAELWVSWTVSAAAVVLAAVMLARAVPLVATPEGWEKISDWVDELREPEGPGDQSRPVSGTGENGAGSSTRPGPSETILQPPDVTLVGVPISQSDELAFWVRVSEPAPRNWRVAVYDTYTGRGWLEEDWLEENLPYLDVDPPANRRVLRQEFDLAGGFGGRLFAAGEPVWPLTGGLQIRPLDGLPFEPSQGDSTLLFGDVRRYQVLSWIPTVSTEGLRVAGNELPPEIAARYLQLPEDLPERVRRLTDRLVGDAENAYDTAVVIQRYLRQTIPYNLQTPLPDPEQDVVDYFLYEAPSGFCSYYASAMAVMLRTQGVPARVVTGYAAGSFDAEEMRYLVPMNAAHAWVEVFFPEYGWVPFEPTPSQAQPGYTQPVEALDLPDEGLTPRQIARRLFWLRLGLGILGAALLTIIGGWVLTLLRRRQRIRRLAPHPLERAYLQLRTRLAAVGLAADAATTPAEYLQRCRVALAEYDQLLATLETITELYQRQLYSRHAPQADEIQAYRRQQRQARHDYLRLWMRFRLQQVRARFTARVQGLPEA